MQKRKLVIVTAESIKRQRVDDEGDEKKPREIHRSLFTGPRPLRSNSEVVIKFIIFTEWLV
jgi:hypothetical protein